MSPIASTEWGRSAYDRGRKLGPWHVVIGRRITWACGARHRGDTEWADFVEPADTEKVCGRCRAAFLARVAA